MKRFLVSFDDGAMSHLTQEDLEAASVESHAVVRDAEAAGVWVFGGGLVPHRETSVVAVDGTVIDGPPAGKRDHVGGFCILEVESRDEAHAWAARFAASCRCDQHVREIMFDPES